ncbi:hypothetical protein BH23BAC1_BH23BAC1_17840 [soil metagenome]
MKVAVKNKNSFSNQSNKRQPFFPKNRTNAFISNAPSNIQTKPFFEAGNSRSSNGMVQTKLKIGQPNDKYEKEADAMANNVMNSQQTQASIQHIQAKCDDCEKEENVQKIQKNVSENIQKYDLIDEEEDIQMKAEETGNQNNVDFTTQLNNSKGNGNALPHDTKAEMEGSFRADFSNVNTHTDEKAVQMSQHLHAQAFTHGPDIYFNKGKYDPSSSKGKHLLAHELTHVVQQNAALREKRIQRNLIYGSGYAGYAGTTAEVGKAKQAKWNPTTIDFSTNAGRSGGGEGAKDLPALIKVIEKQGKGAIKKLGIIGHSNSRVLGLSGDVHTQGVPLTGLITGSTLQSNKAKIDAIKDRFAPGAEITLYSCNSGGISNGLADAVSEAFGVCVKGFSNEVIWCITWNENPLKITRRGNVFYENPNDPLAGIGAHPKCENFHTKVLDLSPDVTSCKGAKKQNDKKCIMPGNLPLPELERGYQLMSFTESTSQVPDNILNNGTFDLVGLKLNDGMQKQDHETKTRVMKMQQRLNHHGASLTEDGMFGKNTLSYIHQFHSRLGMPQTNMIDHTTATGLMLPALLFDEKPILNQIEGLKTGDGLTWGTWHLKPRVTKLQQLLVMHGHLIKIDGMFGPETKKALNNFQARHEISPTEIVDRQTADQLEGRNSRFCPFGEIPMTVA